MGNSYNLEQARLTVSTFLSLDTEGCAGHVSNEVQATGTSGSWFVSHTRMQGMVLSAGKHRRAMVYEVGRGVRLWRDQVAEEMATCKEKTSIYSRRGPGTVALEASYSRGELG